MKFYLSRHPITGELDIWKKDNRYYIRESVVHLAGIFSVFVSPIEIELLNMAIIAESECIDALVGVAMLDTL
jgi:hypothetical protein